jgi:hypothetical protein
VSDLIAQFVSLPSITQFSVAFLLILILYFHVTFGHKAILYAPTILTTIGIFFTFLGIALGLAQFDSANVEKSIPALLDGLKTAFWASVVGVGGALTIKIRHYVFGLKSEEAGEGPDGEITAQDLARLLGNIQHALVGDDGATLVSQLKLTRQDTNDRLDALRKAQQESLQKLSEMGSAKLVEALREVIRDFNAKITEQFGENFKHLNEAVVKLVEWQDSYKHYTDEMTLKIIKLIDSMKIASEHYAELVGNAGAFSAVAKDLSTLIASLEVQKQQLTGSLKALADLLQAASGSLPQIETKIMEYAAQLSNAVRQNQLEVNKSVAENSLLLRTSAQEATKQITSTMAEQQRELSKGLIEHASLIRTSIQTANQEVELTKISISKLPNLHQRLKNKSQF